LANIVHNFNSSHTTQIKTTTKTTIKTKTTTTTKTTTEPPVIEPQTSAQPPLTTASG
jgi:hypothetical protein